MTRFNYITAQHEKQFRINAVIRYAVSAPGLQPPDVTMLAIFHLYASLWSFVYFARLISYRREI